MMHRLVAIGRLLAHYVADFLRANAQMVRDVLVADPQLVPAVVRVPVHTRSPWLIAAYANLISLTPGTLTLDVSSEHDALYVHAIHVSSPDDLRARLAELEARLLEAFA